MTDPTEQAQRTDALASGTSAISPPGAGPAHSDDVGLVARLRELLAKASPRPFHLHTGAIGVNPWIASSAGEIGDSGYTRGGCILNTVAHDQREEDAALIVAAVNALPSLLDRIERLSASQVRVSRDEIARIIHPGAFDDTNWDDDDRTGQSLAKSFALAKADAIIGLVSPVGEIPDTGASVPDRAAGLRPQPPTASSQSSIPSAGEQS